MTFVLYVPEPALHRFARSCMKSIIRTSHTKTFIWCLVTVGQKMFFTGTKWRRWKRNIVNLNSFLCSHVKITTGAEEKDMFTRFTKKFLPTNALLISTSADGAIC